MDDHCDQQTLEVAGVPASGDIDLIVMSPRIIAAQPTRLGLDAMPETVVHRLSASAALAFLDEFLAMMEWQSGILATGKVSAAKYNSPAAVERRKAALDRLRETVTAKVMKAFSC
ncbi:hypothetical protein [Azospirillum sp. sgz302134]